MSKKLFTLSSPESAQEFAQYYHFRWQQLRQPLQLPPGSERDEFETTAFHRMAINARDEIIGVGRIHFENTLQARIRYMATAPAMQHKGVGSAILQDLLAYAAARQIEVCWLKARASVCPFYQQQGFEIIGKTSSELPIVHIRMEKWLIPHKNN